MISILQKIKKYHKAILLAAMLLAAAFFMFYGSGLALTDYDEATYAQVIQHTMESGHYLSLVRSGANWFEKPPFYFWQAFATAKIFGFSEFALRLPSIICGILGVLFAYLLAKKLSGNFWTGLLAGAILSLCGSLGIRGNPGENGRAGFGFHISRNLSFCLGVEKTQNVCLVRHGYCGWRNV